MHYGTGTLIDLFFEFEVQLLGGEESPAGRHHTLSPQPHRFLLGLGKRRREKIVAGMGKKTIVIVFGHQSFVPMRRQHHPGSRAGLSHFGIGARPQYLDLIDNPRFPDRIGDSAGSKDEGTMVRHLGPQAGPVPPVKVHVSVSVKHGILQGFGPRRQEESRRRSSIRIPFRFRPRKYKSLWPFPVAPGQSSPRRRLDSPVALSPRGPRGTARRG